MWLMQLVFRGGQGVLAEYVTAKPGLIYKKPTNVSFEDSSGIALTAMTAYTSLIKNGGLKQGDRVLVNGGSGGVGNYGVQVRNLHVL